MTKVLVINSSLNGEAGNSSKASKQFIDALKVKQSIEVTNIDLNSLNLPHLTKVEMDAWALSADARNEQQQQLADYSDRLIDAIHATDHLVLAVPMYNFGIPSVLKAFFDRIARAGVTFRYTESGPVGLITDKTVTILAVRGGIYQGTPMDTQSDYLKNFLGFLGMQNVNFIYLEGLAMGEEAATAAWKSFSEKFEPIEKLTH